MNTHCSVAVLILCLSLPWPSMAALKCDFQDGKQASNFELSTEARDAIDFTVSNRDETGQSVSSFKALDCRCDPFGTKVEVDFLTSGIFDDDSNLFSEADNKDWRSAAVLRIRDCDSLELKLGTAVGDIPYEMQGAAFIVDRVNKLTVSNFAAGASGGGDKKSLNTFTSMSFRNVEFDGLPSNNILFFGDKADVTFQNVSIESGSLQKLKIDVENKYNGHKPLVRVERSRFPKATNLADGLSDNDATFELNVRNEQQVFDNSGNIKCNLDYEGKVMVKDNTFGVLPSEAIQITGGERLEMEMNNIEVLTSDSIMVKNIASTLIRRNHFKSALSLPAVLVEYVEKTGAPTCETNDMNENDVEVLNLSGNHFANSLTDTTPYQIQHDFGNSDFVKEKLMVEDTVVNSKCECETQFPSNPNDDEFAFEEIVKSSNCTWTVDGEIVMGSRTNICNGDYPPTRAQREEQIRDEVKKDWRAYLAIAVIVTFILTAIITALLMRFCCNGDRGEISPRD